MIMDKDIPTADPGELIIQYTPLIYKIANRYRSYTDKLPAIDEDDLLQAGRIAIYNAQKKYDPDGGASFLTYAFDMVRNSMQRTMGLSSDGKLPKIPVSLDEPISEDGEDTRLDSIPDTAPTAEERLVEEAGHQETAEAVHAAIDRLGTDKQREVIRRVWLDGQNREDAAEEMGTTYHALCSVDKTARKNMKRDKILQMFVMPTFGVGVRKFRTTWTSATEAAVLWRERMFDAKYGDGAFISMTGKEVHADSDQGIEQFLAKARENELKKEIARGQAYITRMKNRKEKHRKDHEALTADHDLHGVQTSI